MQDPRFSSALDEMTLSDRIMRVFYAPESSFRAVRQEQSWQDWMVPVMLMCVVWIASNYLTLSVVGDPDVPAIQQQLQALSEEQRAQALEHLSMWRQHGWISMPVVNSFSSLALVGLILLGLGRWAFKVEVTLRQMLTVKAYALALLTAEWVVRTPLILIEQTPFIHVGPGAFLSEELAETLFGRILMGINVFDLWQAWVMGIGLAVMGGIPRRRGIIAVMVLWAAWILSGAVLGGLVPEPQ